MTAEAELCEQCRRAVQPDDHGRILATRRKRVIDSRAHTEEWVDVAEVVFHPACYPMGTRAYLRHR